ncbi:hypothetical protein MMC26_002482 [Xylographa opegraphella]|nr:hypothetical protein [Xylographa opegraphella]
MQKDPRTGSGHWRGCHSFTNIVCDGDTVKPADGRDGGLMMGGTYWYYYQLNGDIEHHNAAEPSTASCPFLPGQIVNILEVPIQVHDVTHGRCDSASSIGSVHYTLNPEDKYLDLRPPVAPRLRNPTVPLQSKWDSTSVQKPQEPDTKTLLQATSCSTIFPELRTTQFWSRLRSSGRKLSTSPKLSPNCTTSSFDIRSVRRTQSVRHLSRVTIEGERPLSRADRRHGVMGSRARCDATCQTSELLHPAEVTTDCVEGTRHSSVNRNSASVGTSIGAQLAWNPVAESNRALRTPEQSLEASDPLACSNQDEDRNPISNKICASDVAVAHVLAHDEPDYRLSVDDSDSANPTGTIIDMYTGLDGIAHAEGQHAESVCSSARTSELFSPSLTSSTAYSGYMSPLHMGQPHTPEATEFAEYFISPEHDTPLPRIISSKNPAEGTRPDRAYSDGVGFGGYSLTKAEHASSLTIRSSALNQSKAAVAAATTYKATSSQDRVTSWNDGSAALEELFNELSYLGDIIT